jgi:hypothetical protein
VIVAGAGIAALALALTHDPAAASGHRESKPDPPAFVVSGTGTFTVRDNGDAVVNGTGELHRRRSRRSTDVQVAATVAADDKTLPGPGECEGAIATLSMYGARGVDMTLVGYGEVCGHHVQPPTSIVTHVFTGTYEVLDGPRRLIGTDGFFEVRLGADTSAGAFAIDT